MEKNNSCLNKTNTEQNRSTGMNGFPAKAVALFAVMAGAGTLLTATADRLATGFHQTVLAEIGSAIFGAGLTFFLVEVFRWARVRRFIK